MTDEQFPPARTTEHVPIVTDTPFVAFAVPWAVKPPRHSLTVVVKATFVLGTDGEALVPAEEQRPPDGDRRDGSGELGEALVYASDFAVLKPKADVTLSGYGYSSREGEGSAGLVELEVRRLAGAPGSGAADVLAERLALFGPRRWDALGGQSAPQPFERVPLSYARAFGGPEDSDNPVGLGRSGELLPQLEHPDALVRSRDSRAKPACFAPVAAEWPARKRFLGTYGERWLRDRWPYFPEDFDYRYFNAAPERLQVEWLRGDEAFRLRGVRPDGATVQGRLPGKRIRIFAVLAENGLLIEIPARLDTLHFDTEAMEAVVCWRALLEVDDIDASEIGLLFVTEDPLGEVRSTELVREALERALASERGEQEPDALPVPEADPIARAAVVAALADGGDLREVEWPGADLSGLDLSGRDLTGAVLSGADLTGTDLSDAILAGAKLDRIVARGARFDRSDLSGGDLGEAELDEASFVEAILAGATLDRARLTRASFVRAKAPEAVLIEVSAEGADFSEAELGSADLSSATLTEAVFRGARLDDAILYDAAAGGAVLDEAVATDLRCDGAGFAKGSLRDLEAPGASFEAADLRGARLSGSKLAGANLARAELAGTIADGCDLRHASLRKAKLAGAWLTGSDLNQADFDHADLRDADLRHTNLYQAELWGAALEGALFDGAIVAGSKLSDRR